MPLVARFAMNYIFSGTVLDTAFFTPRVVPNAEVTVNNNLQLRTRTGNAHCGAWCSGWQVEISSADIAFDVTPSPQSYSGTPGTVFVLKKIGATYETTYGWPNTCIIVFLRSGSNTASVTTRVNAAAGTSGTVSFTVLPASVLARVRVTIASGIVKVYVDGMLKASLTLSAADKTSLGTMLVPEWGNASYERDGTTLVNNISVSSVRNDISAVFRVAHGHLLQSTFRAAHGLAPIFLKNFMSLCGAVPVRMKTFRVRTEQARVLQKVFRVVQQQLTVLQKVFRVVQQQQHGVLMTVFRAVHGSAAGAALMTVFRAVHGLIADTFRSDDFTVRLSVGNQQVLSWTAATLSADDGRYVWEAAVAVRNEWDTNLLHQFAHVVYHRYGVDYHLIVTDTARSLVVDDQGYTDSWAVQLASPAYMLSSAAALPITKTWPRGSAAKAIVQELCDSYQITLNWQHPEYVIGELAAEKQAPIDIIKAVLNVSGALAQSEPSGALLVRVETPVLPDADAIPDVTFPALSLVSLADEGDDPSVLCNAVLVSDSDEAAAGAGGLIHEETDRADGGKDIKAWAEPWAEITLRPNASAVAVRLTAHGVRTETKEEWLEFVDGVATASKPVYEGFTVLEVRGAAPGEITWLPDSKALTAAAGAEHYCLVRYTWRYYAFVYASLDGNDYQLVLEDV